MKVITDGHLYELSNFENKQEPGQRIQFIHKEKLQPDVIDITTISDGTTNEELLEVLLDRISYLNKKFPCRENALAITHIEIARNFLLQRTRDRQQRSVEGKATV